MSPDVRFSRLESNHCKLVQRIKINCIQTINGEYDDKWQQRIVNKLNLFFKKANGTFGVEKYKNQNENVLMSQKKIWECRRKNWKIWR